MCQARAATTHPPTHQVLGSRVLAPRQLGAGAASASPSASCTTLFSGLSLT